MLDACPAAPADALPEQNRPARCGKRHRDEEEQEPAGERGVGGDADAAEEADEEGFSHREPVERERDEQHEEEERAHHVVDARSEVDPDRPRGGPDREHPHGLNHRCEDEEPDQEPGMPPKMVDARIERAQRRSTRKARSSGAHRATHGRAARAKKSTMSRIVARTNAPSSHR